MKSDEIDDDDEMIFQIRTCNFQRGKYSTVLAELLTVGKLKILRSFSLGFENHFFQQDPTRQDTSRHILPLSSLSYRLP
jgi:hypothetical protein